MSETAVSARQILQGHWGGVLATQSVKFAGYPFGSLVPYCLDETGQPLILISRLAQHTQNIKADPKVALTLIDASPSGDIQQQERLTLLADAQPVQEVASAALRYYGYFPQAAGYHDQLDFEFYRLQVHQARFIAGFGRIHWQSLEQLIIPNPFSMEQEAGIVSHMNNDHREALECYCAKKGIDCSDQEITMCGIDAEGLVLRVGQGLHRLDFSQPIKNMQEARAILVEMAKRSPDYQ